MLTVLDLFSGIGGISLGLESTGGFRTVAFCEIEPFAREMLAAHWPGVPIHDDVRRLGAAQLVGQRIDAIVGGFPCQPHSVAGKRKAQKDERHLWPEFARLIRELRPRWVVAENVPGIRTSGFKQTGVAAADEVLEDLEAAGYACWPLVVGADDVEAPHRRKRVWFVAHRNGASLRELSRGSGGESGSDPAESRGDGAAVAHGDGSGRQRTCAGEARPSGHWEERRDDVGRRGARSLWPVGSPTGQGLEGQRADAGEPQEPESGDAGLERRDVPDAEGSGRAQQGDGRIAGSRLGCDGPRWPARPGEPQHEWEEPRLRYDPVAGLRPGKPGLLHPQLLADAESVRRDGGSPDGRDDEHDGPAAGRDEGERHATGCDEEAPRPDARSPQQPVGAPAHGLPLDVVRRARRLNREALKAAGNSVVPQVVAAIGRAILAAEGVNP